MPQRARANRKRSGLAGSFHRSPALSRAVARWLADFEQALRSADRRSLTGLFRPDAHWRDLLALTGTVGTTSGAAKVVEGLQRHGAGAAGFEIGGQATPPRRVTRAATDVVEAFFRFETPRLRAQGGLPLMPNKEKYQASTL